MARRGRRVIPINELKFALRSPVIGVSILQSSGRRQILIPLEPFVPADFIASVLARYSRRVVDIIFQDGRTRTQRSMTIARSTRERADGSLIKLHLQSAPNYGRGEISAAI